MSFAVWKYNGRRGKVQKSREQRKEKRARGYGRCSV
jgi:hypothetical protein